VLADAKNRFSELVTRALAEGPQRVRRHNGAVVVVVERDYETLTGKRPGFKEFLLGEEPSSKDWILLAMGHPGVRRALEALENDGLFVSVVSIGEIAEGIALLKEGKNRRELHAWLQALERYYADHVLPVDLETSHTWGELTAAAQRAG
jgi:prevent-host-death family protein